MTFNYTSEKRKFDNAWAKLAQTYAEAGMTPEAIQEMYEYDWSVFKANRIEAIHSQGITIPDVDYEEYEYPLVERLWDNFVNPYDTLGGHSRYWWLEELEKSNVENCIAPYFKKKHYTLQELERHPKYIQEFYQHLLDSGLSSSTVIRRHANVRKCLQYAFQIGLIKSNPADRVEKPRKAKYEATIYNQEELDKLFKVVKGDPLELAVILGAFYGLRRSEVVGLKWDAIDFQKKTISIRHTVVQFTIDGKTQMVQKDSTKTKSSCRTLPLVAPFELLLRYLKAEQEINQKVCGDCYCKDYLDYIYVDAMGGLIKPNFITQHFDLLLKKHGLKKIRFHDLRHSCASLLYANGVALKDIQEWLGHSDIGTTSNIYTHLDYSNKVSSANAILGVYPNSFRVGAVGQ